MVPIGAAHKSEAGAAMKHVEVDRVALAQDPVNFLRLLVRIGSVMVLAPVVKPSVPILAIEDGATGTKLLQFGDIGLGVAGAEIDGGVNIGQRTGWELVSSIGGKQQ